MKVKRLLVVLGMAVGGILVTGIPQAAASPLVHAQVGQNLVNVPCNMSLVVASCTTTVDGNDPLSGITVL